MTLELEFDPDVERFFREEDEENARLDEALRQYDLEKDVADRLARRAEEAARQEEAEARAQISAEQERIIEEGKAVRRRLADATIRDRAAPEPIRKDLLRLRSLEEAKGWLARDRARDLEIADPLGLDAFLAEPDAAEQYLIDRIWPTGGKIAFSAQRKAGKTRVVHNLVRSLADGAPFLDEFNVSESRRVALLDFELNGTMLRTWLRGQDIKSPENVVLVEALNGRAGSFAITDDAIRARWARKLSDVGAQCLILDPLRPILRALKLDEHREIGTFLDAFDALRHEAGISEGLISHHHGHHAQRAAGDSSFDGWGDEIWTLTRDDPEDPRAFRFFGSYGRSSDLAPGLLSMYDDHFLAFAADASIGDARQSRAQHALVEWLKVNGPDAKKTEILGAGIRGITEKNFAAVMRAAEANAVVTVRTGEKNAKLYTAAVA